MKIGVDIGGSHIKIGLIEILRNTPKVLDTEDVDISCEDKKIEKTIIEYIENKIEEGIKNILKNNNKTLKDIDTLGITMPGIREKQGFSNVYNLNIQKIDFKKLLDRLYKQGLDKKTQIILRNDAESAGICEKKYGSLKMYNDAIFLTLGTGIGGVVFLNGKKLDTRFEVGHTVIEADGKKCNCGMRGCFEQYASMKALKEKIQNKVKSLGLDYSPLDTEFYDKNIKYIQKEIEEFTKYLLIGILNVCNIFEPQAISFGGSFAYFDKSILFKTLKVQLKNTKTFSNTEPILLVAKYKNDAGLIGSIIPDEE